MKLVVLAAIIAAVSSGRITTEPSIDQATVIQGPWQVGKLYKYDVKSHTLAYMADSASTGGSYRARFILRVKAPGKLEAKLENPEHASVHQMLSRRELVEDDLVYEPVLNFDKPFDINIDGGRIVSLTLPPGLTLSYENLLKGLVGALQVDLSAYRSIHSSYDTYDSENKQGQFRKMETDVTGDCETLYTVSPVSAEWRRELPMFVNDEEPIEVTKSKSYGHCRHRVDYHFGVPEGAEWTGTAHSHKEDQLIRRATVSRFLMGKNGPIYKAQTTSTVNVNPHMYGKQQAEVHSKISIQLVGFEDDNLPEWEKPEAGREILNLLYSLTPKQVTIDDTSSSLESQESMESHMAKSSRIKRSSKSKPSIVAVNKIIIKKRSEESTGSDSSSSSSDSRSAFVNDDIPKVNEPAYAALYMNPQPRGDKKQNPMNAQKLVQEMAQQLQNPNNMPKADFLSKFNILVRIISSMSYGQLTLASRSIEIGKDHADVMKADMWRIYRDAVAQSGTLPAFQLIRTWIQEKKIEGEEAAEVVAVLPRTLRYPTKEAMIQFFDLAFSPEVKDEMYLNTTAIIAASKFIHMGQVDNRTVHQYYPTHMYGRLSDRHDRFVLDYVLPRLSTELQLAIEQKDSHKAQVYIMAIGTLGHRAILDVFAPYLEGKVVVSTYLRTQIIVSLRTLAMEKDRYVRAALYSIIRNTAEPYEVRVAAVFNIFMAHPTGAMMQALAEMTKWDPSVEVRAAIKSTIEYAAELDHPRFFELARSAQGVKPMLTSEEFGKQYSMRAMSSFERDDDVGVMSFWSKIGADDSLLPKFSRLSLQSRLGGWFRESTISFASSGWRQIVDLMNKVTRKVKTGTAHKYSADKIYSMFDNKYLSENRQPAEASFYFDLMNQQRLFAFSEEDLKQWPLKMKNLLMDLSNGMDNHYTKVVNKKQVSIMFPVASGMPFIYKYKEPTVLHVQAKTNGIVNVATNGHLDTKMDHEIMFTYAENHDGTVGFLDTIANQYAAVGVVGKIQVNAPFKVNYEIKTGELKMTLSPLKPEEDTNLLHYSIWPYTVYQKKDSIVPAALDPATKLISRDSKSITADYKFGQIFGTQFHLTGYSYSNDYRNVIEMLLARDPLSHLVAPFNQEDLGLTHFNLKYLGKQSKSKSMTINTVYNTLYNQKVDGKAPVQASEITDTAPNSPARRDNLVKRVATGLNKARAHVLDLSATFDGPQKLEYVLTAAISNSDVDTKVQAAIFAARNSDQYGNSQMNAVGNVIKPITNTFNYAEALKGELKVPFEVDIRYAPKENVHFKGYGERSPKYVEELQRQRLSQQCLEEMASNNLYQLACHKMIIMAYAPDTYKIAVDYNIVNPSVRFALYQILRIVRGLSYWKTEENPLKVTPEGKFDLMFDLSYFTESMNVELNSIHGELRMKNIYLPLVTSRALTTYTAMWPTERVQNYYSMHQYQPYCIVDGSRVRTFSNRRYNYTVSRNWHVVITNKADNDDDYAVLVRRPTEKTQELYISYRTQNGYDFEILIKPGAEATKNYNVEVSTNSKKVSEGELTSYWDDINASPILEYYVQADGVLMINVGRNRLRILFDAQRLLVLPSEGRGYNRGICGYMTGDPRDDYMTPYGLVDAPEHYAASYALNDENSEPKTQQLQAQAKKLAYQPQNRYTAILRADDIWQYAMQSPSDDGKWDDSNVYVSRSYLKKKGCKIQKQVQYYENYAEICITTKAVPACQSNCNAEGYKIQEAQVVCRPKLDPLFVTYKNQIRLGQSPKVSGVPQSKQYRVPTTCIAQP